MIADQYLKVKKENQPYLGERYFKYSIEAEKVVQVCVSGGELRGRGRGNATGVYLIHKLTLASNYFAMNYLERCTKRQYQKKFDAVVQSIR